MWLLILLPLHVRVFPLHSWCPFTPLYTLAPQEGQAREEDKPTERTNGLPIQEIESFPEGLPERIYCSRLFQYQLLFLWASHIYRLLHDLYTTRYIGIFIILFGVSQLGEAVGKWFFKSLLKSISILNTSLVSRVRYQSIETLLWKKLELDLADFK